MGLSSRHRWKSAGDGVVENDIGQIRRVVVDGKTVYFTTVDMRAKPENRITCGPFDSADAAENNYEVMMSAAAGTKTNFSRGRSG